MPLCSPREGSLQDILRLSHTRSDPMGLPSLLTQLTLHQVKFPREYQINPVKMHLSEVSEHMPPTSLEQLASTQEAMDTEKPKASSGTRPRVPVTVPRPSSQGTLSVSGSVSAGSHRTKKLPLQVDRRKSLSGPLLKPTLRK